MTAEPQGWAIQILDEPVTPLDDDMVRAAALLGARSDERGAPDEGENEFAFLYAPEGTPDIVLHTVARGIVEAIRRAVDDVSPEPEADA